MTENYKWFSTSNIDGESFVISENKHSEETNCYLLCGSEKALLIDTGLGVGDISETVKSLAPNKEVSAVASHVHWDHIGGHKYYKDFFVQKKEESWINGSFPLSTAVVKKILQSGFKSIPEGFDIESFEVFQGKPTRILSDGDKIEIGGRTLEVIHTPGHSPGHMCFWEEKRGYLFTGDLVYKGMLYADYPSTDPRAYLRSLEKIAKLPIKRVFPAHHTLEIDGEIIIRMRDELRKLFEKDKLRHGSGVFDYGDWSIRL